ncbi:permease [Clostridium sp. LP20]|uniref:permease n=1 Tax=Clostridium sp. LP20 TaxID=3418665 RepID=UPI003EE6FA72
MIIKDLLKRYKNSIACLSVLIILFLINKEIGKVAITGTIENLWEFIKLVPLVFILLGLMDVWVPKDRLIKLMGEDSGIKGIFLAFLLGSFAAGPLYAAFPIGAMLLRKGSSIRNVMIFIGAWACTKVPMILIEVSSLGLKFAITRMVVEIIGIILIAYIIDRVISRKEKDIIYEKAEKL